MLWITIVAQFLPTIIQAIKAAVDAMPDSPGKNRLEGAVAFVIAAEDLAHADPVQVQKAVHAVHAMLFADNQVPQAPQPAPAPAPAPIETPAP